MGGASFSTGMRVSRKHEVEIGSVCVVAMIRYTELQKEVLWSSCATVDWKRKMRPDKFKYF